MRRATILFTAGFIAALGLAKATEVIACCFQASENAPITLTELRIDGEPAEIPEQYDRGGYNLVALWDGIELTVADEQGYIVGSETYIRRVR
jgi:hypothetical protein